MRPEPCCAANGRASCHWSAWHGSRRGVPEYPRQDACARVCMCVHVHAPCWPGGGTTRKCRNPRMTPTCSEHSVHGTRHICPRAPALCSLGPGGPSHARKGRLQRRSAAARQSPGSIATRCHRSSPTESHCAWPHKQSAPLAARPQASWNGGRAYECGFSRPTCRRPERAVPTQSV